MNERQKLLEEHKKVTGKDAVIIGMFWDNPEKANRGLKSSIERNDPYNEYLMLDKDQRKLYKRGLLNF